MPGSRRSWQPRSWTCASVVRQIDALPEMTRAELKTRLRKEGVRETAFDLDGLQLDEVYCLDAAPTGWTVNYRERGIRRDEHVLDSEDEACQFVLRWILADPTTREVQRD